MGWGEFFEGIACDLTKASVKTSIESSHNMKMQYKSEGRLCTATTL